MISGYIVDSSGHIWREKRLMKAFITAISISILLASSAWSESPEQHLKQQLKGKTVLIRGFFQDDRLDYTAQGEVMGSPQPGSWTVAKMQVKSISIRPDRFEIRGPRVITFLDQSTGEVRTLKPSKKHSIKITVHAPPAFDSQQLDTVINKILATEPSPDNNVFPPYWREFLAGNVIRSKDKDGKVVFKRRDAAVAEEKNDDQPVYIDADGNPVFRVSKSITPPRIAYQIAPDYSESAREQKFTGTTEVSLEVDKTGAVHDVQIVRPIGYGLDDQAVRAVEQWRFSPAIRNGEPVAALVNVEVSFRLY
jgi:TonB family protein